MLIAVVKGTLEEAKQTLEAAHSLAEAVEFRLDLLDEKALKQLVKLKQKVSTPTIFTLRSRPQGGAFSGNERERQNKLLEYLTLSPTYVDLEYDIDPAFVKSLRAAHPKLQIISSYHDFEKTPEDLKAILDRMQAFPADIFKIACFANSTLDSLRVLLFIQEMRQKEVPIAGMCMGTLGSVTRILAPVIGSLFTYAPHNEKGETASGQVTLATLHKIYHCTSLTAKTSVYALIGDPVDKSIGHLCHNSIFRQLGHDGVYVKFQLKPQEFSSFFSLIRKLPFRGFSVTMPLKEHVGSHLDKVDPKAKLIGAINTLSLESGEWRGANTDAGGAFDAIEKKIKVAGKKVVILGAGGTAKALAHEASRRGGQVTIVNRTGEKAKRIAHHVQGRGYGYEALPKIAEERYDLLINTTSVGMAPHLTETPLESKFLLREATVFEVIFNPKETRLISLAKDKGCQVIYGYEMYAQQALKQLEIWLNTPLDQEAILETIHKIYHESMTS